jgi:alpha-glucosidase
MFDSSLCRIVLLSSLACLPVCAGLQSAGNVVSVVVSPDQADFTLDSHALARVQMLDTDLVRVRLNPSGSLSTVQTGAVTGTGLTSPGATITNNATAVIFTTQYAVVVVVKKPFQVVVLRPDQSLVTADVPNGVIWNDGLILDQKIADPSEAFFGLGERGGPINRRGRNILMHNVDSSGYGEFTDPLYISIPFYYGILNGKAYGVFVDNSADPFFDMDSEKKGIVTFGASAGELNYYVMTGPEPSRVANTYARLTGFTQLPPKWAIGYHQSHYGYPSQAAIMSVAAEFRQRQIPCDALWLDINYMNQQRMFTWDPVAFPNPLQMNKDLDAQGFKRVNIIEPLMQTADPLWDFGNVNGMFVLNPDGTTLVSNIWYGDVSFLDFSNPATQAWYKEALAGFLTVGVNGIWSDLNEPAQNFMPQATYDFAGHPLPDLGGRDIYALRELAVMNAAWSESHPNDRYWGVSRSGYAGIQRYSANWSGDTLSTFDSLRVSLEMSISMGFSGQNFFGHDIGGFLGVPSAELYTRWLEFGSYIPLFRTHSTDTSGDREPWIYGDPYTGIATNVIDQRYRMLPYLYSVFYAAATEGTPVLGPLPFYFPADTTTYSQDQSFLLGPSLLVAPIITQGATSRAVYLPQGNDWYDFYTDTMYAGGSSVTASAPLDTIPVYVRAGAILPSGPVMQYTSDPSAPPDLTVDVYPGPDSTFVLYEDDGSSLGYQIGASQSTYITHTSPNGWNVVVFQKFSSSFQTPNRPIWVYLHGIAASPSQVLLNQSLLNPVNSLDALSANPGFFYSAADHKLAVRFEDAAGLQLTVIP